MKLGKIHPATNMQNTWNRFRIQTDDDAKIFSDTVQNVSRHPQLVAHVDAFGGTDLVLPLGRHHLRVRSTDSDSRK